MFLPCLFLWCCLIKYYQNLYLAYHDQQPHHVCHSYTVCILLGGIFFKTKYFSRPSALSLCCEILNVCMLVLNGAWGSSAYPHSPVYIYRHPLSWEGKKRGDDYCKQLWQTPWIPSRSQSPVLLPLSHPASVLGLLGLNRGSVSSVRVLMNTPCEALQLSIVTHSLPTVKSLEQKPVHFRLFSLLPT